MSVSRFVCSLVATSAFVVASGCGRAPADPPAPQPAAAPPAAAVEPHGDHKGRHGGYVLMDERGHMELVFGDAGAITIWFSDGRRRPLAASRQSAVELSLTRAGAQPEVITLTKDADDGAWIGKASASPDADTIVRFGYAAPDKGAPYTIEVGFAELRKMQAAADGHGHGEAHDHEHGHDHPHP